MFFFSFLATDLVLRKVINFSDCTVCLDKRNASGKIEFYQDPLLYKCSFRTRLHFTYDNLNSKMPSVIKVGVSFSGSRFVCLYFVYWLLCMLIIIKKQRRNLPHKCICHLFLCHLFLYKSFSYIYQFYFILFTILCL